METAVDVEATERSEDRARRGFGRLAVFAAAYTYALIVVGGIVRISGSGLGCGDHWPKCHGSWIPPMSAATLIEYTHRLLAAGIVFVVGAVLVRALQLQARPGFAGRGGVVRPALLAAVLLVVQVVLGGITVRLNLSGPVTVLHLGTAMALLGTLLVAAIRGGSLGGESIEPLSAAGPDGESRKGAGRVARMALGGAVLAYLVVLMGAMVANTGAPANGAPSAAALACQGFPLCNGQLLPGAGIVHIQLTHRLLAYLLFLHVIGSVMVLRKRTRAGPIRTAGFVASLFVVLQVVVGAGMVSMGFPPSFRALHLAFGAGVWGALVVWTTLARRAAAEPA